MSRDPNRDRLNIWLDVSLKRSFNAKCALIGRKMSDVAAELIKNWTEGENITPPDNDSATIAQLIIQWGNLEDLAEQSRIQIQRLEQYRDGAKPTDADLVRLGGLFKSADGSVLKTADLQTIRDRTFPPNHKRMPTNGNI